jgi:penicillin amidase
VNLARRLFGLLLGKRLPQHSGQSSAPCRSKVKIRRDRFGVGYVDAENEYDAWFGLGYCHAQDRAGQLETSLRLVRGTLSEVIGREGLEIDRAARLIGVHHAAKAQLPLFDRDLRDQLGAYTDGINAAFATRGAPKSHEHALLRCEPSPWKPEDVIGLGLMMCCLLPSNWDVELARLHIFLADGPAAVAALDADYRPDLPVTSPPGGVAGPSGPFLGDDLRALREFIGESGGSNAWAVSARKTKAGRPLLANDPHLPATLPNFGYLARVTCPEFRVAGVSIVGVPAFISGHNERAAWGSTSAQLDNTDLFLEELGPDGASAREGDRFVPCELRDERVAVRGEAPQRLRVVTTRRGPIVARRGDPESSIFAPLPFTAHGRENALSFAATWLQPRPTRALLSFHRLENFEQFRTFCGSATGCAYSMIYADRETIGWVLASEVPVRKQGHGSLPLPGWLESVGWHAEVKSGRDLPHAENPEAGYVSCANNKPVADAECPVFLGHDFLDGYRQKRIGAELARKDDWTPAAMAELQLDVLTLTWSEVKAPMLSLETSDPAARRALALLAEWDGRLAADSVAATVYELFLAEVCERAARVKAPNSSRFVVGEGVMKLIPGTTLNARRASFVTRLVRDQPPGYFAAWPAELAAALGAVVRRLERDFGPDTRRWTWGTLRPLPLEHRFGGKKPLDRVFNPPKLPGYGDGTTVNQAGFEYWKPLRHSTVTSHLRTVMEVGNWSASRFVLLGGQAGNPLSKNYDDMIPLWQRGEGVPIHWEEAALRAHTSNELCLSPNGAHRSEPGKAT